MVANMLFDVLLVGILLAGAIIGFKNGFLDTVARPVKFIAALALAFSLASTVGEFVVEPIIGPAISHKLSDVLVEKYSEITAANANESLPTLVKFAASMCGVNVENIASNADGVSAIEAIVEAVTAPVVEIMGVIFGFVIAYFASRVCLNLAMSVINTMISGGIIGGVNKALGCMLTLFLAFVVVWGITSISEFIFNIPVIASTDWAEGFSGGPVYKFFRSFTPLDLLLSF